MFIGTHIIDNRQLKQTAIDKQYLKTTKAMKNIGILIFTCLLAILQFSACTSEDEGEKPGSIYGVITDKATGEPIRSAGVQLNPLGTKTVTGSEGQYEFIELQAGNYTLLVTKTGYSDLANYKITVGAGKTAKGDVQIEKLPPSLRVVNDSKQDIASLDFGNAIDDVTRSFSIFNDGPQSLEWELTKTSDWITTVSKSSGTLSAGATQAVIITIDREKLAGGDNTTTIHVTSNNGSKDLTVKATGIIKELATLNMLPVTEITSSKAVFNGKITSVGTPAYTERGFVYSATPVSTIETAITKLTVAVTEEPEYTIQVTGLTLNHTYYVRAYAINGAGVAYSSNEESFATVATAPTLSTQAVSNINIGAGTATFNGTIITLGDPAYTERGFVYGIARNPTIDDTKKIASGTGTGVFSANITEITEGKTYYVRAYATNEKGTVYGEEVNFAFVAAMPTLSTQAVTSINIGAGTATFNGTVIALGDLGYTEKGFVYSATHSPTIDDTKKKVSGTGIGVYSINITGIEEGKNYRVRAYATNAKGTVYGEEVSFAFIATAPTLSTQAVSNINIGAGTATFNGTIITLGDPAYTERGFVYDISRNPTIDDTKKIASGTGTGVFSANITGIIEGKTYYVRAYAKNAKSTVYGEEVSFDFIGSMPTLSTQNVTNINIGSGTATFNGTILSIGEPAYTERGFVYSISRNPTIDDTKKIASGTGTGVFSANITGIVEGKTYYVRAYAKNTKGTVYGEEVSFSFSAVMPTLSTQAVTNINFSAGNATFNGTIITLGDLGYKEKGFVYSITRNPTIDDIKKQASGTGIGIFNLNITGLIDGSTYYVRAYATNNKGTVYGEEVSFTNPYYVIVGGLMIQKEDITPSLVTWDTGVSLCKNSIVGGYTDWRLPTKDELAMMYQNKDVIGGFVNSNYNYPDYWSSTEYGATDAWTQNFYNGFQHNYLKNFSYRVRAVRALP